MKVSIIVPVYNVSEYVEKCLESIYKQTFTECEVIVVDDGSTDDSGWIVDEYCQDKERFSVYHKKNGGLMSAWKYGLEMSKGNYIGFVDSDDYIESTMYEKLYSKAEETKADIVLCNHYYVHDKKMEETIHRNPIHGGLYDGECLEEIRRKMFPLLGEDYISPSRCTKLIRRKVLQESLKYTDNKITSAEDVNIMVPCMLKCKSLYYVDEPLYYYVQREKSMSRVFKQEILDAYGILIKNMFKCCIELGYDSKLKKEIECLYNFYGLLWANYVAGSNLSFKEKKDQLKRIIHDNTYRKPVNLIHYHNGRMAMVYKMMIRFHNPSFFLCVKRLMTIV